MEKMNYPTKKTIEKLTKDLDLKVGDEYTQDWEYEVADVSQLSKYIKYYQNANLNYNEKIVLMRIILEAYNDYISLKKGRDIYGENIKKILLKDAYIHMDTIEYWTCKDYDVEECFEITPFMREVNSFVEFRK